MSAAIDYLRCHGLEAMVKGERLRVSPASKVTPHIRKLIKAHRLELIAEVMANDGLARSGCWQVLVPSYSPIMMIGEPFTRTEALTAARMIWPDAEVREK